MSVLRTDLNTLAKRLTAGLEDQLTWAIEEELKTHMAPIITKVARQMAQNLHGRISAYNDFRDAEIKVTLVLDGKSEVVEPDDE